MKTQLEKPYPRAYQPRSEDSCKRSFSIPSDIDVQIKLLAKKEHRSYSGMVSYLLQMGINQLEKSQKRIA